MQPQTTELFSFLQIPKAITYYMSHLLSHIQQCNDDSIFYIVHDIYAVLLNYIQYSLLNVIYDIIIVNERDAHLLKIICTPIRKTMCM
jgi:hypothetical protein